MKRGRVDVETKVLMIGFDIVVNKVYIVSLFEKSSFIKKVESSSSSSLFVVYFFPELRSY